ncbi:hypothetical protein HPP92_012561 [Vanilla planifolia]|uniref:Uncharacterized protein n=1 Tax=Vanilla planifolia TaxID=51239 RepID=A0A835V1V2_VANPL|nr:hypothetical protein HPP92_012561 [Vanilla planifolia]
MNNRLHPSDECSQAYLPPVAAATANAVVKGENWWSNGNFEKQGLRQSRRATSQLIKRRHRYTDENYETTKLLLSYGPPVCRNNV